MTSCAGQGVRSAEISRRVALNACRAFGVTSAAVPPDFPVALADLLRANGIELDVDDESFERRRRVKTPTQLEGIHRAQRGAEAAVDAITGLLAAAEMQGQAVLLDGEPLTCERLKAAAREAFAARAVSALTTSSSPTGTRPASAITWARARSSRESRSQSTCGRETSRLAASPT